MRLQDLDPKLRVILEELGRHPKVQVGCGAKDVILYIQGAQTQKMVESKIPNEYREIVRMVRTARIRPAKRKR